MEISETIKLENEVSHEELCKISLSSLRRLLTSDKLLNDLPADVTIDEVNAQIAVAQGQSITVEILRHWETPINVVISQRSCTVYDLKKAIQRAFELKQYRSRSRSKISWKYIWRTYLLKNEDYIATSNTKNNDDDVDSTSDCDLGPIMFENHVLVSRHGVKNKTRIGFVKRLKKSDRHYRYSGRQTFNYDIYCESNRERNATQLRSTSKERDTDKSKNSRSRSRGENRESKRKSDKKEDNEIIVEDALIVKNDQKELKSTGRSYNRADPRLRRTDDT